MSVYCFSKLPGHAYKFNEGRRAVKEEAKSFFVQPTVRGTVKQAAVMAYSLRHFHKAAPRRSPSGLPPLSLHSMRCAVAG